MSPARVRGDAALGRAVRNVVENANRHGGIPGGRELGRRGRAAVLRVADDGPGIPADRVDEVFERFTRLDDARSSPDGGTGLGLAIAKDVVERHHGTIVVDRSQHPGACVVITLPPLAGLIGGPQRSGPAAPLSPWHTDAGRTPGERTRNRPGRHRFAPACQPAGRSCQRPWR